MKKATEKEAPIIEAEITESAPKIQYRPQYSEILADPYLDMDRRDDAMIIAEAIGQFSDEYIYQYEIDGKPVRGLSFSGVKEARRLYKMIAVSIVSIDEKPMYYECKARSLDRITGSATEVIYRQAKGIKRRDGSHWENPHAFMICQSKAKRNAIAELLPQALIRGWMNDYEATKTFDGKRAEAFHEKPTPPKLADFNVEDAIEQISSCVAADIKTLTAVYTECWKACPKADRPQIEEAYRQAKVALMPEREPGIDE